MNREESKAIRTGTGRAIRQFLNGAANRHAETSMAVLREQLTEADIPEAHHDGLISTYTAIAKKVRAGENVFELKQRADLAAVEHVRELRTEDSILDEHGIRTGVDGDDLDHDTADRVYGAARGESEADTARRREAQAERDRLTKLGIAVQ